jgi:exosortase
LAHAAQSEPDREGGLDTHILAAILALSAVALCIPAITNLGYIWQRVQYYGHGYAIPPAAAYLVFANRHRIAAVLRTLEPPRFGWVAVFAAASLEVLAYIGDVGSVSGLGISLLLAATAYAIGGIALLRTFTAPLLFLALMIPPPAFVIYEMLFRLKLFVTEVSVAILHALGTTVLAQGNQILVPGHTLFVADACSGLTSIITMLPIACVVAYFMSSGIWRRAAVVGAVIPLAIGANILRVTITVALVPTLGAEAAQGMLHESFGIATYVVGTLGVVGVARVLR